MVKLRVVTEGFCLRQAVEAVRFELVQRGAINARRLGSEFLRGDDSIFHPPLDRAVGHPDLFCHLSDAVSGLHS